MTACTRCETALEDGDLRCAICALPVALVSGGRTGGTGGAGALAASRHAQVLRCGDCGAAVGFVAERRAPHCGFCGQTMAIEQPVDPVEAARLQLPFRVDRAAAEFAVRGWLARRGWFAPRALSRDAVLESLTPIGWAAWQVNATARVAWTADSDAGAGRAAWAPHAGELALEFRDIIVPASRGLREAECRMLIPYYALASALPIASEPAPDAQAAPQPSIEQFDAQRSAARVYVQERIAAAAKVRVERHVPGRRFRNIRVACQIERQTTERVALPAWILAYRYRGAPYRAIVHGQRAEVVVGRSPLDWGKLTALIAVIAGIAAIIALVILLR